MNNSPSWASPFIITRDSARWLGPILDFYLECRLSPIVLLDSRSSDNTEAILKAHGTPYMVVDGDAPRVEGLVKQIANVKPNGWVLRMDDDEAPSRALVSFLKGPPPSSNISAIALPRWHLWRDGLGRMSRGRWTNAFFQEALEHDWQWRLFQPDRVKYTSDIHTPGFLVPEAVDRAPPNALIAHLVWIVRNADERRAKIKAYDAQKSGAGSFFESIYVPEDVEGGALFDPVILPELETLVANIMETRL